MAAKLPCSLVFSKANFEVELTMLDFAQFRVSFTQDAQGYFEIVWLLSVELQVCLQCYLPLYFVRRKLPKYGLIFM